MAHKILMVEDDFALAMGTEYALTSEGYEVATAGNLAHAREKFDDSIELVLLDVMLPEEDGLSVLKKLRGASATNGIPVIMLTAKNTEFDRVTGLDCGADDFVSKPFGMMELLARVRAVLRRTEKTPQEQQWQVGPLYVCPQRRQVQVNGQDVLLTYKEFEILSLLLQQQGRVMTREMLMDRVWGLEADRENRTLDVHIRTLRQKLGEAGHLIETVRGVGYKIGGRA